LCGFGAGFFGVGFGRGSLTLMGISFRRVLTYLDIDFAVFHDVLDVVNISVRALRKTAFLA
jgi:hypothetical protein